MKLKQKINVNILIRIEKCLILATAESKYYDDSNKLVAGKVKDETGGIAMKEFVGLKPKMSSFLVGESSEHIKAKDANRNVVA